MPDEFADAEARRRSLDIDRSYVPSRSPSAVEIFLTAPSDDEETEVSVLTDGKMTVRCDGDEDDEIMWRKEAKDIGNFLTKDNSGPVSLEGCDFDLSYKLKDLDKLSSEVEKVKSLLCTVENDSDQFSLLNVDGKDAQDSDVARRISVVCLEDIGHIDSPETTDIELSNEQFTDDTVIEESVVLKHDDLEIVKHNLTDNLLEGEEMSEMSLRSELVAAGFDVGNASIVSSPEEDIEPLAADEDSARVVRGCSLAHFSEGNDIGRRSFYKKVKPTARHATDKSIQKHSVALTESSSEHLDVVQIQIQGSNNNLSSGILTPEGHRPSISPSETDEEIMQYHIRRQKCDEERRGTSPDIFPPVISVIVDPPSPSHSDEREDKLFRRFSEDSTGKCKYKNIIYCNKSRHISFIIMMVMYISNCA